MTLRDDRKEIKSLNKLSLYYAHESIQISFEINDRVTKNSEEKNFHNSVVMPQCEISIST